MHNHAIMFSQRQLRTLSQTMGMTLLAPLHGLGASQPRCYSRDQEDTSRKEDPLIQADDALVLDNSDLTPDQQLKLALGWAQDRIG